MNCRAMSRHNLGVVSLQLESELRADHIKYDTIEILAAL